MEITIEQTSINKITAKFKSIGKNLSTEAQSELGKAISGSALELETAIKRHSDMPVVTGRLRSSIHAKTKSGQRYTYTDKTGNTFDGSLKEPVKQGESAAVGTNVEYAQSRHLIYRLRRIMLDSYESTRERREQMFKSAVKVAMR